MLRRLSFVITVLSFIGLGSQAQLPYHIDSTFGVNGISVITSTVYSIFYSQRVYHMSVMTNGKIVLGGFSGGSTQVQVLRLKPNGSLDSTFNSTGAMNFDIGSSYAGDFSDMKVDASGNVFLAGTANYQGSAKVCLYKVNASGVLDPTFGVGGIDILPGLTNWDFDYSCDLQTDGKIMLGGQIINATTGNYEYMMLRLNANGSLDNTYGQSGRVVCPYPSLIQFSPQANSCQALICQPDDKTIVAGYYTDTSVGFIYQLFMVRYNTNGTPDSTFGLDGLMKITPGNNINLAAKSLQVSSTGDFYVVCTYGSLTENKLVAFKITGSGVIDSSYGVNGMASFDTMQIGYPYVSHGSFLQNDNMLVATGTRHTDSIADYTVCRLTAAGTIDNTFGMNGTFTYTRGLDDNCTAGAIQANGDILMAGFGKMSITSDTTFPICLRITDSVHAPDTTTGLGSVVSAPNLLTAFPNPSLNGTYTITIASPSKTQAVMVRLFDISGKLVGSREQQLEVNNSFGYTMPPATAKGIYYLECTNAFNGQLIGNLKLDY